MFEYRIGKESTFNPLPASSWRDAWDRIESDLVSLLKQDPRRVVAGDLSSLRPLERCDVKCLRYDEYAQRSLNTAGSVFTVVVLRNKKTGEKRRRYYEVRRGSNVAGGILV